MNEKQLFRAKIERGAEGVDRTLAHNKGKGVIFGAAILTKGRINEGDARDWEFDDTSLSQVMDLGNTLKVGAKSRFGHPNMSGDAMGTFLGRAKNFRKDGDIVRADIYFDSTSYETPDGNLADYVMGLAESDPAAFGTSMVFMSELDFRMDESGKKKKDADGNELPGLVRFKKLFAVDVVDDPAANKGMFGKFMTGNVQLSAEMTSFLDKFLNNPDAVEKTIAFLKRYQKNNEEEGLDSENKEEVGVMEIKELTLEMLKAQRIDLVELLHKEGLDAGKEAVISTAKTEAAKAEKERVTGIFAKAKTYQSADALAQECIDAGDSVEVTEGKFKSAKLALIEKAAPISPGPGGDIEDTTAGLSLEEKCKQEFAKDPAIRAEFKTEGAYYHFKKADAEGRVKIQKK